MTLTAGALPAGIFPLILNLLKDECPARKATVSSRRIAGSPPINYNSGQHNHSRRKEARNDCQV